LANSSDCNCRNTDYANDTDILGVTMGRYMMITTNKKPFPFNLSSEAVRFRGRRRKNMEWSFEDEDEEEEETEPWQFAEGETESEPWEFDDEENEEEQPEDVLKQIRSDYAEFLRNGDSATELETLEELREALPDKYITTRVGIDEYNLFEGGKLIITKRQQSNVKYNIDKHNFITAFKFNSKGIEGVEIFNKDSQIVLYNEDIEELEE